jgi:hypothetical protein
MMSTRGQNIPGLHTLDLKPGLLMGYEQLPFAISIIRVVSARLNAQGRQDLPNLTCRYTNDNKSYSYQDYTGDPYLQNE